MPRKLKVESESVETPVKIKKSKTTTEDGTNLIKGPKNVYLVAFKIEGKQGWRYSGFNTKELFDEYLAAPGQAKHGKVTERRWFTFDKLTGDITEEK